MGGRQGGASRALTIRAEGAGSPAAIVGTADQRLAERLVTQVADALWLPAHLGEAERVERIEAAVAALKGLAPRDEMEGMLATQMVATHGAAMECLRRAMLPDQDLTVREANLRQAGRLLALYAKQVETLNRNRGKGQQKVTVEHVRVESGGQAIVGTVSREQP
ncbi:hypothetical protein [Falsiroseomonas sp.]|uniref:hypothetical protein n=1 Tax=Falsiroseomonas sp. TaxID=2870721 RepID=UPI0035650AA1